MKDQLNAQQCREIIAELAAVLPDALATKFPRRPSFEFEKDEEEQQHMRTRWDPVFTGGGIVGLLITDAEAQQALFTKDVDVVLEIATNLEFCSMESALELAGFKRRLGEEAERISWDWNGVDVDTLPNRRIISLPHNPWFVALMQSAQRFEVLPGRHAWIASAPCFVATKFQAFWDRGRKDILTSKDLKDILAVVNGRSELLQEIHSAAPDVLKFLQRDFGRLLEDGEIMECMPKLVPEDIREEMVLRRIREICSLT